MPRAQYAGYRAALAARECRQAWKMAFDAYYAATGYSPHESFGAYDAGAWGPEVARELYPEVYLCRAMERIRNAEARIREANIAAPHFPDSEPLWRKLDGSRLYDSPVAQRDRGIIELKLLLGQGYAPAFLAALDLDREEASMKLTVRFRYYVLRRLKTLGLARAWHETLRAETGRQLSPAWRQRLDDGAADQRWDGWELQEVGRRGFPEPETPPEPPSDSPPGRPLRDIMTPAQFARYQAHLQASECMHAWTLAFNAYYEDTGHLPNALYNNYFFGGLWWGLEVALTHYPEVYLCRAVDLIRANQADIEAAKIDALPYPDSWFKSDPSAVPWDLNDSVKWRDHGYLTLKYLLDRHYAPAFVAVLELDRDEMAVKLTPRFRYYALRRVHAHGLGQPWHETLLAETGRQLSPAWRKRLDQWEADQVWGGGRFQELNDYWSE